MRNIFIRDTAFAHTPLSTPFQESAYVNWCRNEPSSNEVVFYTDDSLHKAVHDVVNKKIAWLFEPYTLQPRAYDFVYENQHLFDLILCHDKDFVESISDEKSSWVPACSCWIEEANQLMHKKSTMVSIISSNKKWLEGHALRHAVIEKLHNKIDVAGNGYRSFPLDGKIDLLKDYAFHIVIENNKKRGYFTEKIIDAFVTGAVPIYWGDPEIGKVFNEKGIIICKDIDDIVNAVNSLSMDLYHDMLPYARENFKTAMKYRIAEDWIFENLEEKIFKQ